MKRFDGNQLFTWPVILGALGVAVVLMVISLAGTGWLNPLGGSEPDLGLAAVTVIPAPSGTPMVQAAAPTDAGLAQTPAAATVITVGAYVQISGTEGEGLRVRSAPGLSADPIFLAYDEEVFEVRDGPQDADGYTWWYLVAPYDETRAGWAAANFLALIPPPTGE